MLPERWFGDSAPVLRGVLSGLSSAWAAVHDLLLSVRQEARLATATDRFLDLACVDFFDGRLVRRLGETDEALRARLQRAMHRLRGTRQSLVDAASEAGFSATVFEPARPADTGAYGTPGGLAWGIAGGWGSLQMPLECLVTVRAIAAAADPGVEVAEAIPAGGICWIRVAS
jgi:hypothetical protein